MNVSHQRRESFCIIFSHHARSIVRRRQAHTKGENTGSKDRNITILRQRDHVVYWESIETCASLSRIEVSIGLSIEESPDPAGYLPHRNNSTDFFRPI